MSRDETTSTLDGPRRRGPLPVVLKLFGTVAEPQEFALTSGTCTVGAGAGVDVVVRDPTMSRRHLEFELVPEGVVVRDLGSRNGTFYLGQRLVEATLELGSRIRVGKTEITVELDQASLHAVTHSSASEYASLQGASPQMRQLFALLARIEGSLASILVQGESGTGKELVARAIHERSRVARGPFVAVNCGALDRSLAKSELFGHSKGAFTSANETRVGFLEAANDGTLFLDEIGELPLDVQPLLLRALETKAVTRLGETQERAVNVRIIAATHRDLSAETQAGRFRSDLFYRLVVIRLELAPLRERPEDVRLLSHRFASELGLGELPEATLEELVAKKWPGNVRELRNEMQAFAALGCFSFDRASEPSEMTGVVRQLIDANRPYMEQKEKLVASFLGAYVKLLLERTGGNQSEAARISGLDRSYLNRVAARLRAGGDD